MKWTTKNKKKKIKPIKRRKKTMFIYARFYEYTCTYFVDISSISDVSYIYLYNFQKETQMVVGVIDIKRFSDGNIVRHDLTRLSENQTLWKITYNKRPSAYHTDVTFNIQWLPAIIWERSARIWAKKKSEYMKHIAVVGTHQSQRWRA